MLHYGILIWKLRHRDMGAAPRQKETGNLSLKHHKSQLPSSSHSLLEFHHWRHFFGIGILFVRYLFANILHKTSNLTNGISTENKTVKRWEANELRIKNGEVRVEASGVLLGKMRTLARSSTWGGGCQGHCNGKREKHWTPPHSFAQKLPSPGELDRIIVVNPSR